MEVLNCCGRLLFRIEFNNSFPSVLAQVVFYQLNLINLTNCCESGVDFICVPVVWQVGDEDLVGEESNLRKAVKVRDVFR